VQGSKQPAEEGRECSENQAPRTRQLFKSCLGNLKEGGKGGTAAHGSSPVVNLPISPERAAGREGVVKLHRRNLTDECEALLSGGKFNWVFFRRPGYRWRTNRMGPVRQPKLPGLGLTSYPRVPDIRSFKGHKLLRK